MEQVPDDGQQPRAHEPRLVARPLDLKFLHRNSKLSDPMGEAFDYAKEFKSLDLMP